VPEGNGFLYDGGYRFDDIDQRFRDNAASGDAFIPNARGQVLNLGAKPRLYPYTTLKRKTGRIQSCTSGVQDDMSARSLVIAMRPFLAFRTSGETVGVSLYPSTTTIEGRGT
jgi:hypothetical protein